MGVERRQWINRPLTWGRYARLMNQAPTHTPLKVIRTVNATISAEATRLLVSALATLLGAVWLVILLRP